MVSSFSRTDVGDPLANVSYMLDCNQLYMHYRKVLQEFAEGAAVNRSYFRTKSAN